MHPHFTIGITLLISVQEIFSACICTNNQGEVHCTIQTSNSQDPHTPVLTKTELPQNQPLPFTGIRTLQIQCKIQTIHPNWLTNQGSLTELEVIHTEIPQISKNLFQAVPNLQRLILSHNKLRNPPADAFSTLKALKTLDLSYNRISNIERSLFEETAKLEQLYFNNNGLFEIEDDIFSKLPDLKVLDLSYNHLRLISLEFFKETEKLKDVNLASNNFDSELPLRILDNLKKVVTLNLSDCKIRLPQTVFDATTKLVTLDLSINPLSRLPRGVFEHLKDLKSLNLAHCQLLTLAEGVFNQNARLEDLNLSHNSLRRLPDGIFNVAQRLKYLSISNNLIRNLPPQLLQHANLIEIDLNNNLITRIPPELFNVRALQRIHLQSNKISDLNELTISSSGLKFLDLRKNRLVFIKQGFLQKLPDLEKLEILGNPWDCRCLDKLIEMMADQGVTYTVGDYYQGTSPICVTSNLTTCAVNQNDLNYYYELYK